MLTHRLIPSPRIVLLLALAAVIAVGSAGCTADGSGPDSDASPSDVATVDDGSTEPGTCADAGATPDDIVADTGGSDAAGMDDTGPSHTDDSGAGLPEVTSDAAADPGPCDDPMGPSCEPQTDLVIEPLWMAGYKGDKSELGAFGKPDAIFLDDSGVLFAGDEGSGHEELHLFDVATDDPTVLADMISPIADIGADPGPAGTGELEFAAISGLTRNRVTGQIYIVEQGNGRIQVVQPGPDGLRAEPHLVHEQFFGAFAPNKDLPGDGQFVRLQAIRTDSLGRVFISDDAKKNATTARRDIQVFSPELEYLDRFGGLSYGALGEDGNLKEPENFVIDEARDRIYVCDEGPSDVVVYQYSDLSFVARIEDLGGVPNGIDIDAYGYLYVVVEGSTEAVRVFDPDTFEVLTEMGGSSAGDDPTPGLFNSPDTLQTHIPLDLLVIADQGHDRVQGFSLSQVQGLACIRTARVSAPPTGLAGHPLPVRVDVYGPDGKIDVRTFDAPGRVDVVSDSGDSVATAEFTVSHGRGSGLVTVADAGSYDLEVHIGGLTASAQVEISADGVARTLSGELSGDDLHWSPETGAVALESTVTVPEGETLQIDAGTVVVLAAGASLEIDGGVVAAGTADAPIAFIPPDTDTAWGSVVHTSSAAAAQWSWTFFVGGGDAEAVGHCCGPALRHNGDGITLSWVTFMDCPGKAIWSEGDATIQHSLFQRLEMGPELAAGAVLVEDSHFLDFAAPDDGDALYIRNGAEGAVRRSYFARGTDDGVDFMGSTLKLEGIVSRDYADKAVSMLGGTTTIDDSLLLDSAIGLAVKDNSASTPSLLTLRRTTIAGHDEVGYLVFNKNGQGEGAIIDSVLEEVIIWGNAVTLETDYDPADISVQHSVLVTELAVSGQSNVQEPPAFIAPSHGDYRVNLIGPAGLAGEDCDAVGWPGFDGSL